MGKPRMIILVRHGQSEGNKSRDIHQFVPDHRVKLTPTGHTQAEEAGRRLRSMLRPDDSVMFFTSPYRRTRDTADGILRTLTGDDPTPSPFPRHMIKVYEEPRLREQDFGNFQPCSAEMERMWQERADYGHFFYRIPNGESAADAYDRISGFNESLWRQFGEAHFPSVCVLVTHGLMTRVFLMKWYHWSVEYFEDLRNINHCEFIIMNQKEDGKYRLDTQLRTWSELKSRTASVSELSKADIKERRESAKDHQLVPDSSSVVPERRWGGCVNGCNHAHMKYPRRTTRKNTADFPRDPTPAVTKGEAKDSPVAPEIPVKAAASASNSTVHPTERRAQQISQDTAVPVDQDDDELLLSPSEASPFPGPQHFHVGRDFGGSRSGVGTPAEWLSDNDSDYFDPKAKAARMPGRNRSLRRTAQSSAKNLQEWIDESGMLDGKMADKLGDGDEEEDPASPPVTQKHASAAEAIDSIVDQMKDKDRKGLGEVY